MSNHWSREDLPHWDTIRDADDMRGNGLRSQVIDIALDTVVDHLNAHHPKSEDVRRVEAQRDTQKTKARRARRARDEWQRKCEIADDNASMWFGEAVEQRERADRAESLAEAAKATAHTHLETLVSTVAKRDAAVKRAEAAGRELAAANDELGRLQDAIGEWSTDAVRQQMQAWDRLAGHPFFADCYKADGSLIDAMIAKLDEELIVTCEIVDEPDPVEEKARELWSIAGNPSSWPEKDTWVADKYRRMARHVLGDAA